MILLPPEQVEGGVFVRLIPPTFELSRYTPPLILVQIATCPVVGSASTVKLTVDATVPPMVITETGPVVAPLGTATVSDVAVAAVTVARVPLNLTVLFAAVAIKLDPEMFTVEPGMPEGGLMPVIVGAGTVKLTADTAVPPVVSTETGPVVAALGTATVSDVADADVTVAGVPLNLTVLFAGVVLKFDPVMLIIVPVQPDVGLMPVTVGVAAMIMVPALVVCPAWTVKFAAVP
jgi:hypothetical protein